jgi:DNA-binding NtrC family response regulator
LSPAALNDLVELAARKLKKNQLAVLHAEIEAVLAGQRLDRKLLAKRLGVCLRTLNTRLKQMHAKLRKLLSCIG